MCFTTVPGKINCRGGDEGAAPDLLDGHAPGRGYWLSKTLARLKMMLEERECVVKAYRDLKKIKHERLHSNTASLKRLQNLK
ncbi:coiled-coil domain-containing protein 137 [Acipenser oxyrinchus oxyrinchus]|uniref:Coiled-coil domain-containing protein 137 n=1 Tax=Acipenser oxyrinchus oxyrinchus TaxID=40147 RepID=A0AAD8D4A1_ACIOX|nr:coiled-coil domain-containing protein 137 [Acipenser oxyrinchus oxyrinchus]